MFSQNIILKKIYIPFINVLCFAFFNLINFVFVQRWWFKPKQSYTQLRDVEMASIGANFFSVGFCKHNKHWVIVV